MTTDDSHTTESTEPSDATDASETTREATTAVDRRTLLGAVGVTAAGASLAGCFWSTRDGDAGDGADATDGGGDGTDGDGTDGDGTDDEEADGGDGTDDDDDQPTEDEEEPEPDRLIAGAEPCAIGEVPDGEPITTVGSDVDEDLTLGAGLHRVTDHVEIRDGATLTIEPGATVVFEQDAGLVVTSEGTLTAVGTCEAPVLLTGAEGIRGYWHGIFFAGSMRTDNRLEYVVVEYGGNDSADYYDEQPNAAVGVYDESYVSIDHCTLRESPGYGLRYGPDATIASCEQNAFTRNASAAVDTRANGAHFLSATSTYTGNDRDRIRVRGGWGSGWGGRIAGDQSVTWEALDVPYHVVPTGVNGQFDVEGELTVAPEAELVFAQDVSMRAVDGGSIALDGGDPAEYDPITLTGENEEPGFWRGVFYMDTEAAANAVRNVVVEHGGRDTFRGAPRAANLVVQGNAHVTVEDATLRRSGGYGLSTGPWVEFGSFERNQLTENANGPVHSWTTAAHFLTPSNTYTGNDTDEIRLWGGYATYRDGGGPIPDGYDVTWKRLDVDYRVVQRASRDQTEVHGDLTIEPGVTIRFAERGGLETRGEGSINAVGTADEPITFTGTSESPGFWGGIHFVHSRNGRNELRNVVVEHAGSHPPYRINEACSVSATDGGAGTIADSEIRNGAGFPFAVLQPDESHFQEYWSDLHVSGCTVDGEPNDSVYVDDDP